mmetsp:Transcript_59742/g.98502  ORF Transcript_59742/g.98502 Transcript_59742/m.98502 type:complete len:415 (+) Transcript_59742:117-1361(+)
MRPPGLLRHRPQRLPDQRRRDEHVRIAVRGHARQVDGLCLEFESVSDGRRRRRLLQRRRARGPVLRLDVLRQQRPAVQLVAQLLLIVPDAPERRGGIPDVPPQLHDLLVRRRDPPRPDHHRECWVEQLRTRLVHHLDDHVHLPRPVAGLGHLRGHSDPGRPLGRERRRAVDPVRRLGADRQLAHVQREQRRVQPELDDRVHQRGHRDGQRRGLQVSDGGQHGVPGRHRLRVRGHLRHRPGPPRGAVRPRADGLRAVAPGGQAPAQGLRLPLPAPPHDHALRPHRPVPRGRVRLARVLPQRPAGRRRHRLRHAHHRRRLVRAGLRRVHDRRPRPVPPALGGVHLRPRVGDAGPLPRLHLLRDPGPRGAARVADGRGGGLDAVRGERADRDPVPDPHGPRDRHGGPAPAPVTHDLV